MDNDKTTQLPQKSNEPSQSEIHEEKLRALGLSVTPEPSKGNLSESHFDRLWQRMAEVFGHSWVSSFGTEPNDSWKDLLADLNEEDIRFGLIALRRAWKSDFPPNAIQFRALCKPVVDMAHKIYRRLPEPEEVIQRRKANGMIHVSEMRGILDRQKGQENT